MTRSYAHGEMIGSYKADLGTWVVDASSGVNTVL